MPLVPLTEKLSEWHKPLALLVPLIPLTGK